MNYIMNISQKERIFLDSSVIIGLFSGDDDLLESINFFQMML